MTAASDRTSYQRSAQNWHIGMGLVLWLGVRFFRYWYLSIPAFFWFLLLCSMAVLPRAAFGQLVQAALVTWLCVYLRTRQKATAQLVAPVTDDFVGLRQSWNRVAGVARLSGIPEQGHRSTFQGLLVMLFGHELKEAGPEILDISDSILGPVLTVRMYQGQTIKNYLNACEVMKNLWQVPSVRVEQPSGTDTVRIMLVTKDPLVAGREITPDSIPVMTSLAYVEAGCMESGAPFNFRLQGTSSVLGGVPEAGKSITLSVIMAGIAQRPDVAILAIDLKEMLEFDSWIPRLSGFAGDQEGALEILNRVEEIRKARGVFLRAAGKTDMKQVGFSAIHPLLVVVVDECAELFAAQGSSREAKALADDLRTVVSKLVRLGRAMGVIVLLSTQKPTVDNLPGGIRDNCSQRVALRCTTGEQAKAILGDAVSTATTSPTEIGHDQKGYAIVHEDGKGLALARSYYISEDTKRAVAAATAHLTIPLAQLK